MYILRFVSMIFYGLYSILFTFFQSHFDISYVLILFVLHRVLSIFSSSYFNYIIKSFSNYRSDNILDENDRVSPVSPFLRLSFVYLLVTMPSSTLLKLNTSNMNKVDCMY